jgi:hypothetical protein
MEDVALAGSREVQTYGLTHLSTAVYTSLYAANVTPNGLSNAALPKGKGTRVGDCRECSSESLH